jgi:ATP-dependent 26S proteasome regulatory subunit
MKFTQKNRDAEVEENPTDVLHDLVREEEKKTALVSQENPSEHLPLDTYLKASYSLIWIRTEEDDRAVELVKESISKLKSLKKEVILAEFKSTSGLMVSNTPGNLDLKESNCTKKCEGSQPVNALQYITANVRRDGEDNPIVLLMHNVGHAFKVPQFLQCLRDTAIYSRLFGCHIILIGAEIDIPPGLNTMITVYDLALPSQELFRKNFTAICTAYKHLIKEEVTEQKINQLAASAVGMTEMQGENAIALSIVHTKSIDPKIIQYEKEQAIKRNEVLEFVSSREDIHQLGGWEEYKEWLGNVGQALDPAALEYGLTFPKGVLVVGIQGCGKSLAARATSSHLGIPMLKFDMGRLFTSKLGASEGLTRQMAKTAEAVAPVVLWIDEIDKGASGLNSSGNTDGGTTARVMATLLQWMQETKKQIFFFATCNNIHHLPPEVYRRGRFTEIWGVEEPGKDERRDIWTIKLRNKRPTSYQGFDIDSLLGESVKFTGAEIEVAVDEAMYRAFSDGKREFTTADIIYSLKKMIPQYINSEEQCDAIREWMKDKVRMVSSPDAITIEQEEKQGGKIRRIH